MIMPILFPVMVSFTAWKDGFFFCVLIYCVNGRAPLYDMSNIVLCVKDMIHQQYCHSTFFCATVKS